MIRGFVEVALVVVTGAIFWTGAGMAQDNTPGTGGDGVTVSTEALSPAEAVPPPSADKGETAVGKGLGALARAAEARKYLFVFFHRADDEPTRVMKQAFEAAMPGLRDRAESVTIDAADPAEKVLVDKLQMSRAPLPLVLALAPNGAITRSFVGAFDAQQATQAFVSPGMEKALKALQDRKLVLVCVQNGATQHNAEALQGVREFAGEAQYAKTTEIITLDPTDAAEESFLKQLKVDPKTEEAVTVFMAPPGTTVGTYKGETRKDVLVAAAKIAAKGCDPKSGCCPKKPANPPAQSQPAQQSGSTEKKP